MSRGTSAAATDGARDAAPWPAAAGSCADTADPTNRDTNRIPIEIRVGFISFLHDKRTCSLLNYIRDEQVLGGPGNAVRRYPTLAGKKLAAMLAQKWKSRFQKLIGVKFHALSNLQARLRILLRQGDRGGLRRGYGAERSTQVKGLGSI